MAYENRIRAYVWTGIVLGYAFVIAIRWPL